MGPRSLNVQQWHLTKAKADLKPPPVQGPGFNPKVVLLAVQNNSIVEHNSNQLCLQRFPVDSLVSSDLPETCEVGGLAMLNCP